VPELGAGVFSADIQVVNFQPIALLPGSLEIRIGARLVGGQKRLAVDLKGEAEIGTMAWIPWLVAMAAWFATSARCGSDRSTPQIAKSRDLNGNVGPLLF